MKVVVTSPSFSKNLNLLKELGNRGYEPFPNRDGRKLRGAELVNFINASEASAAIVGLEPIDEDVLSQCPGLKTIAKYGVGLDNIDTEALKRHGVNLGWRPGVNKRSVSEQALWFLIGHFRNLSNSIISMRSGQWRKNGGCLLSGRRIGIVGLGNVGQDLARLLTPFQCELSYYDILDKSKVAKGLDCRYRSYDDLLQTSEAVTFHIPYNNENHHFFGQREITKASDDVLIVNTSRGNVIDFNACVDALKKNQIGGLACDVFPEEPFDASCLQEVENLYCTPHIGGNAKEAVMAMGMAAIEGLEAGRGSSL